MSQPAVCCVMLANGRPEMVRRAVQSFEAQTYQDKRLLIYDTGGPGVSYDSEERGIVHCWRSTEAKQSIGELRNKANGRAWETGILDIFCHFDSDDWSHPRRIEEQVALLQSSGKDCVAYRKLLFWDTRKQHQPFEYDIEGAAWVYSNPDPRYITGTSMCYWRSAWESCPFDDKNHEDQAWWLKNSSRCLGVPGFGYDTPIQGEPHVPRLIASIHGENTSEAYSTPEQARKTMSSLFWRRAPEFDGYCQKVMAL
jgi:hypothetical protein